MPAYTYLCKVCGNTDIIIHPILDDDVRYCPICNMPMSKCIGSPMVMMNGSAIVRPLLTRDVLEMSQEKLKGTSKHNGNGFDTTLKNT